VDLWRIGNHASLAGDGGLRASGRWHSRGRRIVYCAQTPAAALLEILVHFEIELHDLPVRYRLLRIVVPDDVPAGRVRDADLPDTWPEQTELTRGLGDTWLKEARTALLTVPSAVVPSTFNVLLNPAHPDARRITVVESSDHVIDRRLLK
jgi:RES domain-containing protein